MLQQSGQDNVWTFLSLPFILKPSLKKSPIRLKNILIFSDAKPLLDMAFVFHSSGPIFPFFVLETRWFSWTFHDKCSPAAPSPYRSCEVVFGDVFDPQDPSLKNQSWPFCFNPDLTQWISVRTIQFVLSPSSNAAGKGKLEGFTGLLFCFEVTSRERLILEFICFFFLGLLDNYCIQTSNNLVQDQGLKFHRNNSFGFQAEESHCYLEKGVERKNSKVNLLPAYFQGTCLMKVNKDFQHRVSFYFHHEIILAGKANHGLIST